MKIFLSGSEGFIGKEVAAQLKKEYTVVGYDLRNGQDISDYEALKESMAGCDVVVHLAAIPRPRAGKTFADYFETNCQGTLNVAQAAMENRVARFVFASSTSYYGAEKGMPLPTPIAEANPTLAQHATAERLATRECDIAYSTSKVIAEQILANFGLAKKFEAVILRLGPTRKTGEHKPFLDIGLHLKIENAVRAIEAALRAKKRMWYEAFTITDENEHVDLGRAKGILGYAPL